MEHTKEIRFFKWFQKIPSESDSAGMFSRISVDFLVQILPEEHWTRFRTFTLVSNLPNQVCEEAIYFSNWLRNRLTSKRIRNDIPIFLLNANTRTDFSRVIELGRKGFAYAYGSDTTPNKKLLPRSILGCFVSMKSDTQLYRVCIPNTNKIIVVWREASK